MTSGSRLVALTFIDSRIANSEQRERLFELNEVAVIAGTTMDIDTYRRLQRVSESLLRYRGGAD